LAYGFMRLFNVLTSALLAAANVYGQTPVSPPPTPNPAGSLTNPGSVPVAQALVPEGVYAIQLLKTLKLGAVDDDAQAETLLSNYGIEPKNGWISDYPVTPAVLGELDNDIAIACDQGKIQLTKKQATQQVSDLKARLGFHIDSGQTSGRSPVQPLSPNAPPSDSRIYTYFDKSGAQYFTDNFDSIPPEYKGKAQIVSPAPTTPAPPPNSMAPPADYPQNSNAIDPNVLYSYYQNQGPPVVTYYPPPDDYYYLYSWVDYPFWSGANYFPGYFVLNNFQQQVIYNQRTYSVAHHAGPVKMFYGNNPNAGGSWYPTPQSQSGARNIIVNQQNPGANGMPEQRYPLGRTDGAYSDGSDRNNRLSAAPGNWLNGQRFQSGENSSAPGNIQGQTNYFRQPDGVASREQQTQPAQRLQAPVNQPNYGRVEPEFRPQQPAMEPREFRNENTVPASPREERMQPPAERLQAPVGEPNYGRVEPEFRPQQPAFEPRETRYENAPPARGGQGGSERPERR
ncbi:MAG: hypothetical protein ABSB19_19880, partial [Methylomonas sp.]